MAEVILFANRDTTPSPKNILIGVLMNKSDLIKSLAEKQNIFVKEAGKVIDFIFKSFSEELGNGGRIEIRGFGVFYVKDYAPYKGRNPRTGEPISIKGKKLPVFKVGKELKERIN
jgi:integration host factor subunit beta